MAQDATQVRVGVSGRLYVAPVGTAFPTTTAGPWTGFVDVGLLAEPGPAMAASVNTTDVMAWQAYFPVRTVNTSRGMEWKFKILQSTGTALKLSFGGGTITSLGGGDYRYDPPAPGVVDERALGLEVNDGAFIYRWLNDRAILASIGDVSMAKDASISYDLSFRSLDSNSGKPWRLITNDAAMTQ